MSLTMDKQTGWQAWLAAGISITEYCPKPFQYISTFETRSVLSETWDFKLELTFSLRGVHLGIGGDGNQVLEWLR